MRVAGILFSIVLVAQTSALAQDAPLLKVLDQFTAADVPEKGPAELPAARTWWDPATNPSSVPANLPGKGLSQHPMLYAGEGFNTLFVVKDGKVIWTYSSGKGGEIDDVWMLTNGHILYSRMGFIEEVTPQKKVVFHFDAPAGTEIHTCQPIGLDKVLFVENGLPPKAILMNKSTSAIEMEHALPAPSPDNPKTVHPQFRHFRMTKDGTYLAAHLNMNKVAEYDKDFKEIWSYAIPSPWTAVRLHNGNTLINDEKDRLAREVNPKGETVWEFKQTELPPGIAQRNNQTTQRLTNGNTVICASTAGAKGIDRIKAVQIIEVAPDKTLAWALQDWTNLGPATAVQLLDQSGIPENPGELER